MTIQIRVKKVGGKRKRSKKTGKLGKARPVRYIVMEENTSKRGFGRFKIKGNKKTRKEADALKARLEGR